MGKISKLYINGKVVDIDDKDAVQLPDELQNGDTLVYDEETDSFVAKSTDEAIGLQTELNNQEKPVASKTVKNAIASLDNAVRGGIFNLNNQVVLEYDYKPSTHEVRARAFNDNSPEASFDLGDKLDIAVFCLDADYDSVSEAYYIGSFLGIITIDNTMFYSGDEWDIQSLDSRLHYSGTLVIPDSAKTRVLNFVVLNSITSSGIVRKSRFNNIMVPSSTAKTITVSSSDVGLYESQLIFTLNQTLPADTSIDLKVTICDGRDGGFVKVKTLSLTPGDVSFTLNIGESGYTRNIYVEIVDSHDNDYTLINSNIAVSGRLPIKLLVLTLMKKHAIAQVLTNRNINIISGSTKYTDLNPATDSDINLDTNNKLEIYFEYRGSNSAGSDSIVMDGLGYTTAEFAEEFNVDESEIPLLGRNIHNFTNININELVSILTLFADTQPDHDNDAIKYVTLSHQQFELWIRDDNGYLISAYTHNVKYNTND